MARDPLTQGSRSSTTGAAERRSQAPQALEQELQILKGVGPATAARLADKDLRSVGDVLFFMPRGYEDRRQGRRIGTLKAGEKAAVSGEVVAAGPSGGGRARRYEIAIDDGSGVLRLVFFHFNPYRMRLDYRRGETLWVFGQVSVYRGARQMAHPEISRQGRESTEGGLVPVYPEVAGVHRRTLRKIVGLALRQAVDQVVDPVPADVLRELSLPDLKTTLTHLHRPQPDDEVDALIQGRSIYHQRLAFDEFFHLQIVLAQRRAGQQGQSALPVASAKTPAELAAQLFDFELTTAQQRVLDEIARDLRRSIPMARLLQGDVGSGKTAVAAVAASMVIRAGLQVAFLVPTEVLAEQHRHSLQHALGRLQIDVAGLTGSTRAAPRRQVLQGLAQGSIRVVVGTHALLQDDVRFASLGLVIIDEQHRFGVKQRSHLNQQGRVLPDGQRAVPHQLVMTATPIPRSLSMTLYGDLALSVIDALPPGRQPVETQVLSSRAVASLHQAIARELDQGGRVFVVYPLVEESDKLELGNATAGAEELRARFPDAGVGLITGRLKGEEKNRVMQAFASGQQRILVATTVIEVGIDVPEASLMVIHDAQRFGLSQLHQLRGRVGRGRRASRCILVSGQAGGKESWRRLKVMEQSNDGFRIAEEDLAIRGPGDLLGTRQAGLPSFAFADLIRHGRLLEQSRRIAMRIVAADPGLKRPEHRALARSIEQRFASRLALLGGG